jgi:hypothetical protein
MAVKNKDHERIVVLYIISMATIQSFTAESQSKPRNPPKRLCELSVSAV